ncbi:MAG: hypothetical protein SNH79_03945 [Rikenellaceae bacterium]
MKLRTIITAAILSLSTTLSAQNLTEYYSVKNSAESKQYILTPQEIFEDEKGRKLSHSVTIEKFAEQIIDDEVLPKNDMVTITLSFTLPTSKKIRTINIKSRRFSFTSHKAEPISTILQKKMWVHKYRVTTTKEKVKELYSVNHPPIITIILEGGEVFQYTKIHKAWMKYAPIGNQIFELTN